MFAAGITSGVAKLAGLMALTLGGMVGFLLFGLWCLWTSKAPNGKPPTRALRIFGAVIASLCLAVLIPLGSALVLQWRYDRQPPPPLKVEEWTRSSSRPHTPRTVVISSYEEYLTLWADLPPDSWVDRRHFNKYFSVALFLEKMDQMPEVHWSSKASDDGRLITIGYSIQRPGKKSQAVMHPVAMRHFEKALGGPDAKIVVVHQESGRSNHPLQPPAVQRKNH